MLLELEYNVKDLLYENEQMVLRQAIRVSDKMPVILKILKDEHPKQESVARLKREFQLLKSLDSPEIIKTYDLRIGQGDNVLILECLNKAETLYSYMQEKHTLEAKIQIAIKLAEALKFLQSQKIIHKDINPNNIILTNSGELKLIDFDIASSLSLEGQEPCHPDYVEGTLAYMSPEQTGMMNRGIDYRTDFYSLGVTLYELFSGRLPFECKDPSKLLHSHVAVSPKPLHEVAPKIPPMLSAVIMKLLEKSAENRYQSAKGLEHDLNICLLDWQEKSRIDDFTLAEKDLSPVLHIPQKLYGREKEVETLYAIFDKVCQGSSEILWVEGVAGIGKTMLIQEIFPRMTSQRCFYCSGKFDQFNRATPYLAIRQALQSLIKQMLTLPQNQLEEFKKNIVENLGDNVQLILEIVPDLEYITGPQKKKKVIEEEKGVNQFHYFFQKFFETLLSSYSPLIIFLDDMQWADRSSISLLQYLLMSGLKNLLFVGAYRNNEISPEHPFVEMVGDFEKENRSMHKLALHGLEENSVNAFVEDLLTPSATDVQELSENIYKVTKGNPFFMIMYLKILYEKGLLSLDLDFQHWIWSIAEINHFPISADIAKMVINNLRELPVETQQLIQLASCIGSRFSLKILSIIAEKSIQDTAKELWPLLEERFILPCDPRYRLVEQLEDEQLENIDIDYRFVHDKVQHAAYELMDEHEKPKIHLQIGNELISKLSKENSDKYLLEVTKHHNLGMSCISDPDERIKIAELNLRSVKKMTASAAFAAAIPNAEAGISLLPEDAWDKHYSLTLALYRQLADLLLVANQIDKMMDVCSLALSHIKNVSDRLHFYLSMYNSYATLVDHTKAFNVLLKIYHEFGIHIPKKPTIFHVIWEYLTFRWMLRKYSADDLLKLPQMKDPKALQVIFLLNKTTFGPLTQISHLFSILAIFKMAKLTLKYGLTKYSATTFAFISGVLAHIHSRRLAKDFMELAESLAQSCDSEYEKTNALCYLNVFTTSHFREISSVIKVIKSSITKFIELGDVTSAGYAAYAYIITTFFYGYDNLGNLKNQIEKWQQIPSISKKPMFQIAFSAYLWMVNKLIDPSDSSEMPDAEVVKKEEKIKADVNMDSYTLDIAAMGFYTIMRDVKKAYQYSCAVDEVYSPILGWWIGARVFYVNLSYLAYCASIDKGKERRKILKSVNAKQKELEYLAKCVPTNYLHRYELVEAEKANLLGENQKAMELYDNAIQHAKESNYVNDVAIACELAGIFNLKLGKKFAAKAYLIEAVKHYKFWGAKTKVEAMMLEHRQLFLPEKKLEVAADSDMETITTERRLDIAAKNLADALQLISVEVEMDKLMEKIILLLMESGGGERASLFLERDQQLFLEAEGSVKTKTRVMLNTKLTEDLEYPYQVLEYVQKSKKSLILENAYENLDFKNDPYIKRHKTKSILCIPIIHKSAVIGLLYLENNLVFDAFVPKKVNFLELISSQAAISLENSQLIASYQRFLPIEFFRLIGKERVLDVNLGDFASKQMTILFSDIRNFTTISENQESKEIFHLISKYLSHMEPIIAKHHGFIDKYIGDAIMAIFPATPDDAVEAGLALIRALKKFNEEFMKGRKEKIAIGIGCDTGVVAVGTVGHEHHMESSVFGNIVNIASRLEDLNKVYQTQFLVEKRLLEHLSHPQDYHCRFIDQVVFRGKTEHSVIFEIYDGNKPSLLRKKIEIQPIYNQAIQCLLEEQFNEAASYLKDCLEILPEDPVLLLHFKRCEKQLRGED